MMLVAKTSEGTIINIMEETRAELELKRDNEWCCPSCQQRVIMKVGTVKQPHFAHKERHTCQGMSEPETMEHIMGKSLIYRWAKEAEMNVQLEYGLTSIQQRPDIWLDEELAIEFQCSPLSLERLAERNQGYDSLPTKVTWLLGEKFRLKDKLTNLHRAFVKWHPKLGNYLLYLDVRNEQVIVAYHIQELAFTYDLFYSELTLTTSEFFQFIRQDSFSRQIYHQWQYSLVAMYQKQFQYLKRALYSRQKNVMMIQHALYEAGYHILALHPIVLLPNILSEPLFLPDIWQRVKFLKSLQEVTVINKEDYMRDNEISGYRFEEWLELLSDVSLISIEQQEITCLEPIAMMLTEEGIQQFIENKLNNRMFVSRLPHNMVS